MCPYVVLSVSLSGLGLCVLVVLSVWCFSASWTVCHCTDLDRVHHFLFHLPMASLATTRESVPPLKRYRLLGHSGLRVSPLCLGAMTWGTNWEGWGISSTKDESQRIFNAYVDAGGNFIDTAVNYQEGQSEEWLGEFMEERGNREELVIATKYSGRITATSPINAVGNSRASIRSAVKKSLQRLRTDWIDVYYVSFPSISSLHKELRFLFNC